MNPLKDLLDEAADRAKVYDVTERALAGGRRRRKFRLAAGSGIMVLAAGAMAAGLLVKTPVRPLALNTSQPSAAPSPTVDSPWHPTACAVSRLPMPANYPQKSALTAGDPTGRFLGGRAYPADNRNQLLLWDNGQVKVLPSLGGDPDVVDINSNGTAIITAFRGEDIQSWVYHDGKAIPLKGTRVQAMAISAAGVIVGMMENRVGEGVPVVWHTFTSEPVVLALPGANWSAWASEVDDSGFIVGTGQVMGPNSTPQALFWTIDGQAANTPNLPVPEGFSTSIRGLHGSLVTVVASGDQQMKQVSYWRIDLRTGLTAKVPITDSQVRYLNAQDWYVKPSGTGEVLVAGGAAIPLPDIEGHYRHPRTLTVSAIRFLSEDGRTIAGYQDVPSSRGPDEMADIVAVVWRCG